MSQDIDITPERLVEIDLSNVSPHFQADDGSTVLRLDGPSVVYVDLGVHVDWWVPDPQDAEEIGSATGQPVPHGMIGLTIRHSGADRESLDLIFRTVRHIVEKTGGVTTFGLFDSRKRGGVAQDEPVPPDRLEAVMRTFIENTPR